MNTSQIPAGSVVVGIDGSSWSDGALDWATDQAALEHRPLTIVHATESMGRGDSGRYSSMGPAVIRFLDDGRAESQALLDSAVARAHARAPQVVVHPVLSSCDPRTALIDLSHHATVIVIGSRGRGPVASLLLGSVSVSVAKHAACPVVVRRSADSAPLRHRILVGVDGTETSLPAIEFAYRMASLRDSELTVLHCYWTSPPVAPSPDAALAPTLESDRVLVAESLAGMAEKFPEVVVEVQLRSGFADHHLIAASADHDLVVVGHHPLNPFDDLILGSVAPAVLEHAKGAIAVVPASTQVAEQPLGP